MIPHMTRLQALSLRGSDLQELPPLSSLTALQTLELHDCQQLQQLPPLDTLTALQTLQLNSLVSFSFLFCRLQRVPPLAILTALQTLQIAHCTGVEELPTLATLTGLQTRCRAPVDRLTRHGTHYRISACCICCSVLALHQTAAKQKASVRITQAYRASCFDLM
jgi:hypothetical protein